MDKVRRISTELINKYPERFADEFEENKKIVNELAKIRSKVLRNMVAGYITSYIRKHSPQTETSADSSDLPHEATEDIDDESERQQ